MQNSYSFVVDLYSPGFSAKFKTGDGTQWEVKEHWAFLDNSNSDLVENIGHIIIVRQRNNRHRAYKKAFFAYPLEKTDYTPIQKEIDDIHSYWFSITVREYDENFRPRGTGSFQKVLCTLTFIQVPDVPDAAETDVALLRRNSTKKRYDYLPLQNISSTDVKSISLRTVVDFLLEAFRMRDVAKQNEAIQYIAKNYAEVKNTKSWWELSATYPELKDKILDMVIEDLSQESGRAGKVLQTTVSMWSLQSDDS